MSSKLSPRTFTPVASARVECPTFAPAPTCNVKISGSGSVSSLPLIRTVRYNNASPAISVLAKRTGSFESGAPNKIFSSRCKRAFNLGSVSTMQAPARARSRRNPHVIAASKWLLPQPGAPTTLIKVLGNSIMARGNSIRQRGHATRVHRAPSGSSAAPPISNRVGRKRNCCAGPATGSPTSRESSATNKTSLGENPTRQLGQCTRSMSASGCLKSEFFSSAQWTGISRSYTATSHS